MTEAGDYNAKYLHQFHEWHKIMQGLFARHANQPASRRFFPIFIIVSGSRPGNHPRFLEKTALSRQLSAIFCGKKPGFLLHNCNLKNTNSQLQPAGFSAIIAHEKMNNFVFFRKKSSLTRQNRCILCYVNSKSTRYGQLSFVKKEICLCERFYPCC